MTLKFNKKVILITSIASVVAGVTGFVLAYIFNFLINEKIKDPKKKSIQEFVLITGSNCYHFHHYMIAAVLIVVLVVGNRIPILGLTIIISFLIGGSLEDFLFKDAFKIKNNCHMDLFFQKLKQQ